MLRSTVDRVRSCWNFRYVQEPMSFGLQPLAPPLHAVDPRTLNGSLPTLRSVHGEGCNNEALRVLSSVGADEEAVGRLTAGEEWSPLAVGALDEALGQLSQCAVVLLDRCDETMRVIRHWMPWLAAYYDCSTQRVQVGTTAQAALSADAERIIRTHNALDERVYAFAVQQLDAQLRLINATLPSPAAAPAVSSLPLDEIAEARSAVRCVSAACSARQALHAAAATPQQPPAWPATRVIWVLWLQGWEGAPPVTLACVHSWRVLNPTWQVVPLTGATLHEHLSEEELQLVDGYQPHFLKADAIRWLLLARHGGVWVDATSYCVAPLDRWLRPAWAVGGLWAPWDFDFDACPTVNFLFADGPSPLVRHAIRAALRSLVAAPTDYSNVTNYLQVHLAVVARLGDGVVTRLRRSSQQTFPSSNAASLGIKAINRPERMAEAADDLFEAQLVGEAVPYFKLTYKYARHTAPLADAFPAGSKVRALLEHTRAREQGVSAAAELSIVFVCHGGDLELKCALLAASLRHQLGAAAPLVAAVPDGSPPLSRDGLALLSSLGVRAVPSGAPFGAAYPIANKIGALAVGVHTPRLLLLDSDVLCLRRFGAEELPRARLAAKPADVQSWAGSEEQWRHAYEANGVPSPQPPWPYFNSGALLVDAADAVRLADAWEACCRRLFNDSAIPHRFPWLDQICLPVAMRRLVGGEASGAAGVEALDMRWNHPSHLLGPQRLEHATLSHYHQPAVAVGLLPLRRLLLTLLSTTPRLGPLLEREAAYVPLVRESRAAHATTEEAFRKYSERARAWASDRSIVVSGVESAIEHTAPFRSFLERWLRANSVASLVEASSGHWPSGWQRVTSWPPLEYAGFDLMAEVVVDNQRLFSGSADRFGLASARFDALDMLTAPLPPAEVLLTKDTLIHFSNAHVMQFLRLSVIRCPPLFQRVLFVHDEAAANDDISTGQYRPLNLSAPPFALPTSTVFTWTANVRKVVEVLEPETLCTAAATRQSD
ncbi:hypothetical protein AB1Y20_010865 [Prymnesium parvum]